MLAEIKQKEVAIPTREKILALQDAVSDLPNAMTEEELEAKYNEHYFAPGMYGRLMHIPKDMVVVGKIHFHAHINVIIKGLVKVVTEFDDTIYEGPRIWVSEPGTKRAVYALEDTDWLTVHTNPDDVRDIRKLEAQIIAPDFATYDRLRIEHGDII